MSLQYFSTRQTVSLREAITRFATWSESHSFGPSLALLYGTTEFSLNRIGKRGTEFQCLDYCDNPVRLETIYEARLFHEKAELRWLNDSAGFGRAVIVGEEPLPAPDARDEGDWSCDTDSFCFHLERRYLVWGEIESVSTNGWTRFSTARIGGIWVPVTAKQGKARFHTIEYLKEFDDGNVAVFQERIVGLEVYDA